MGNCVNKINSTMNENFEKMIKSFELFYKIGVENIEESSLKLNTFQTIFKKMNI